MATVINNPGPHETTRETREGGVGAVVGVIVILVVLALLIIYGLPALRGGEVRGTGTEINVPRSVDVNVNPGTGGY